MNERAANIETEIASIERKADQACSIHAWLRDKYRRRAYIMDYGLLASTTYLLGLTLVEPAIGLPLSLGFDRGLFVVILSLITFFFSIVQFKNDWKSKAEALHKSFKEYADVKSDCRSFTSGVRPLTSSEHQRIRSRYDLATDLGTNIPDSAFVRGKAHHLRKVFVSRYLDKNPGAITSLVHIKLFLRDNLGIDLLEDENKS